MILHEKINFKKLKTHVSLRLSLSTATLSAYETSVSVGLNLRFRVNVYCIAWCRPMSFRSGVKTCELPLSRRDRRASLRGGFHAGDEKKTERVLCGGDEIFPKASRKAGRHKSVYHRSMT